MALRRLLGRRREGARREPARSDVGLWLADLWHRLRGHSWSGRSLPREQHEFHNECTCGGWYRGYFEDRAPNALGTMVITEATCVRAIRYQRMHAQKLPRARAENV